MPNVVRDRDNRGFRTELVRKALFSLDPTESNSELLSLYAEVTSAFCRTENGWERVGFGEVSFCKHYGRGNDAVLKYLSRCVFRTAISNARIQSMDRTHVTFRYKDRRTDTWLTRRIPGVEFLRRFLLHVLPRGFHRVRYYGLWHHSKRPLAAQAWLLLTLHRPRLDISAPKLNEVLATVNQEVSDFDGDRVPQAILLAAPCCPYCGGHHTKLLGEYSRFGLP